MEDIGRRQEQADRNHGAEGGDHQEMLNEIAHVGGGKSAQVKGDQGVQGKRIPGGERARLRLVICLYM